MSLVSLGRSSARTTRCNSVVYSLGMIGEAIRILLEQRPAVEHDFPRVAWREAIGFRNRVFHAYWETLVDVVWDTAHSLEELVAAIEKLRDANPD